MSEPEYRTRVAQRRIERLRELLRELPQPCAGFFRAIQQITNELTRLAYAYDLRLFFHYLYTERYAFAAVSPAAMTSSHLAAVTREDIEAFVDYLVLYYKRSETEDGEPVERTIQNHELGIMRKLSCLRTFFEYLFSHDLIPANVVTLVPLPKLHEKPILTLTPDEMARLLSSADTGEGLNRHQAAYHAHTRLRDYAMLMLFLGTGIRVSECVGLNLTDFDLTQNAFLVTRKGGDQVMLYFPDEVADALKAYMIQRETIDALPGHEDALFLSMQRRRMTQRAVQNLVKKFALIAAPLKKRLSPHKLRSTYGTNLYMETGDIYLVADALGHTDVNTTRRHYAAMQDSRRREAARYVRLPERAADHGEKPSGIDDQTEEIIPAPRIDTGTNDESSLE